MTWKKKPLKSIVQPKKRKSDRKQDIKKYPGDRWQLKTTGSSLRTMHKQIVDSAGATVAVIAAVDKSAMSLEEAAAADQKERSCAYLMLLSPRMLWVMRQIVDLQTADGLFRERDQARIATMAEWIVKSIPGGDV